jgi:hypothetical protein
MAITTEQKIIQAYRDGKETAARESQQRIQNVFLAITERRVDDFPQLDTGSAALAATGWNDCRETLLKAIGVEA